jgi:hypothetical protein
MPRPRTVAWALGTGAAAGAGYAAHDILGAVVAAVVTAVLGFLFERKKSK